MEKRRSRRVPRRLVVDYEVQGLTVTGITRDLGVSGLFVLSTRLPAPGSPLRLRIHRPEGGALELAGRVSRARRAALTAAGTLAGGFGFTVEDGTGAYHELVASLGIPPASQAAAVVATSGVSEAVRGA